MPRKRQPDAAKLPAQPYQPTEREQAVLDARRSRRHAQAPRPRLTVAQNGERSEVSVDHPDPPTGWDLLHEALGGGDSDTFSTLVGAMGETTVRNGHACEATLNMMLGFIADVAPRDGVERLLATQMATVHQAMMIFAQRVATANNPAARESAERGMTRLARTYTAQMEALRRHRTGGKQTVRVEHVTVEAGGQAIVGNVTRGGGGMG